MPRDVKPPTLDDVMRELAKPDERARRAYIDGRLYGSLILVARKARVAWTTENVSHLTNALVALSAAEVAAGVDLTTPTEEDLA